MTPDISYIVATYNRPKLLAATLASLAAQTHQDFEVIVTDNMTDDKAAKINHAVVAGMKDSRFQYVRTAGKIKISDCYWSAEYAVKHSAKGQWLCFPNDDCLYAADFAETMLRTAKLYGWEMVCADVLYRWNSGQYGLLNVNPGSGRAPGTKSCFLVRRDKFSGFRMKPTDKAAPCAADAAAILDMCRSGISWGVVQQPLLIHG